MMKFLRSQSQTVLVIVLGVIGLGFLFYGSAGNLLTSSSGHLTNDYGRINGEDLSVADVYDAVRNTRYSLAMAGRGNQVSQAAVAEEAWGQLLLLHEADRLHIYVSDQELADNIRNQQVFQKDGVFNPQSYQSRMAQLQMLLRIQSETGPNPLANTEATFETLIRNNLRIMSVNAALFSTVRAPAGEVASQYEKYEAPTTVSYITFDPKSFADAVQVTPGQIEAEYKAHPDNPAYRSKEKRKVDYVLFMLSPEEAKLPAPQKATAMEALGEKALQFALAFQPDPTATAGTTPPPPDFQTEAKKRGLTPATTDFFEADTKPANVPPSPSFNNAAFALTKDNVISKVVELDNGLAVLHLAEIQPSDLLPLDQVKAGITQQLRETGAQQQAEAKAQTLSQLLKIAAAKGTDFKAAAAGMNLKVETAPSFVPDKVGQAADARIRNLAYVATILTPGQVSDPIPSESDNTLLVAHLDSRAKADTAGLADFELRYRTQADQQLQGMVYRDWVDWKSKQPGTHKPPNLDQYGGIE